MIFRRSPGLTQRRWLIDEAIVERLDDVFGLLVGGSPTAPSRQQTMRAALDGSYGLLVPSRPRPPAL
jgi:predicted ATPase